MTYTKSDTAHNPVRYADSCYSGFCTPKVAHTKTDTFLGVKLSDSCYCRFCTPQVVHTKTDTFPGVKLSAFMLQEILDSCIAEQRRILRCVGRARRVGLMRRFVEGCGD